MLMLLRICSHGKKLQRSYKVYFNALKTIDFIEVLDNVTIELSNKMISARVIQKLARHSSLAITQL